MAEKLYGYANEFGPATELNSVEEVACFIFEKGLCFDLCIKREDGSVFITTFGFFLDWIADMEYREELLEVLIPLQMGEVTVDEIRSRHASKEGGGEA